MRAFIAIELPPSIQNILYRTSLVLDDSIKSNAAVRWTKPENIHLTLRFLGEVQPELIPHIGSGIDQRAALLPEFDLKLNDLGCFPNPNNPKILWVGIRGNTYLLNQLHRTIDDTLTSFGWEPEIRPFQPHLTIGRVRLSNAVRLAQLPYGQIIESPSFSVNTVSLVESILKSDGATYTTQYKCPLLGIV